MKSIFKNLFRAKNQKGVALLIVISSLMVLTTAVVEFVYHSRIHYRLAINSKDRLKAYYLAKSGLNLSRLFLKYNKEAQSLLEQAGEAGANVQAEPLYRMIPFSSSLIRGIMSGETAEIPAGGGNEGGEDGAPAGEVGPEEVVPDEAGDEGGNSIKPDLSLFDKEAMEKFLSFDGDFSTEILEEQTKYDINRLSGMESTSQAYDLRKKELFSILMLPRFSDLFENQKQDAEKLVHAIADWVDQNDLANEFDNVTRGSEDSSYSGVKYRVKNGKMMTLSELRLVNGMTDKIYSALKPFVTVYGATDKINVCLGEEDMLKALIYHYAGNSGCARPVDYEDEKNLDDMVSEVISACPNPQAMARALNSKMGLVDLQAVTESSGTSASTAGDTVSGCLFQFKDLVTSDNKVFTVRATGTVGDIDVTIAVVVNTESSNPDNWKYHYYRIE